MSSLIQIKATINQEFYKSIISDFLFSIIKEGCRRKIAIEVLVPGYNDPRGDHINECIFNLYDSFNRRLVDPLFANDNDYEVCEYRPKPITVRLNNLQGLIKFIFNKPQVQSLGIYFHSEYSPTDTDLEIISTPIDEFTSTLETLIKKGDMFNYHYEFYYEKPKTQNSYTIEPHVDI